MLSLISLLVFSLSVANYSNPIISKSLPDPTVIRVSSGEYYMYATEDTRNVPIYRSSNLVKWDYVGTAFTNQTRPNFISGGTIWAPDINYINGRYVLYYAMAIPDLSVVGRDSGCGVAYATKPEGPFSNAAKLFTSPEIGVTTSIDPVYIEDGGKKYLIWGSFNGIYSIELNDDGLQVKSGAEKKLVVGNLFEASYILKRGNYFYYFGSMGKCCDGVKSTYEVAVGRSTTLFGPYYDKKGNSLLNSGNTVILSKNDRFIGPGHNSKLVQDDSGNDWMVYHSYDARNESAGRLLMLDRVLWDSDGWPYIQGGTPSLTAAEPSFK
jgi:arabinan endo-1,5-alpha-L-arabinosidase